ncbi:acyl carrier protein [Streptomyces roseus]|uniref:acyl carrier protein n=1 Tax=Streptomyces roseus TaxID=66430 RepID=UPI003823AE37
MPHYRAKEDHREMQPMSDCYEALAYQLTHSFSIPRKKITPSATLDDVGLDSLGVVELFLSLQEIWGIPLDEGQVTPSLTIAQTATLIEKQLTAARGDTAP